MSGRDIELLGLIAEQYTVTLGQLARLIGRSYRTARGLRDRWCNAGWTRSAKLTVDLAPFVWLTPAGSRLAGSPFRTWEPNPGLPAHIAAVTDVRLLLEHELRLGDWESERALAQATASAGRVHRPDGVLHRAGRVAIEVELTLKSRGRLQAIIEELSETYEQAWYFTPDRLAPALTGLAEAAPYGNVVVLGYPPLVADVMATNRA